MMATRLVTIQLAFRWQFSGAICLLGLSSLGLGGCSQQSSTPADVSTVNTVATSSGNQVASSIGRQPTSRPFKFATPVRMQTDEGPVRVDIPGYAAPCWADVSGDGKKDLLVGQFNGGKIRVYENLGDQKLAEGEWLQAAGEAAKVPGVW